MSEGHELGIPTPPLAQDAQQQPTANASETGEQGGRGKRRGRPRPRGGARERERREKLAQRQGGRQQEPVHLFRRLPGCRVIIAANAAANMRAACAI